MQTSNLKTMETMKREFTFLDAKRNKVEAEAEITTRNGYYEFTASGNYANGGGQVFDHVQPANDAQKRFIDLWREWHLNGMNAGTELQSSIVKGLSYDDALAKLVTFENDGKEMSEEHAKVMSEIWAKLNNCSRELDYFNLVAEYGGNELILAVGDDETSIKERAEKFFFGKTALYDNGYRYGSGWIRKELSENFDTDLETLIDEIEELEEDRKGEPLTDLNDMQLVTLIEEETMFSDDEAKLCAALVKMFGLTQNDLGDIEIDGNRVTVQGTDYLAGTDDEMDEEWDNDLDNYLEECVYPELPKNMQNYFDNEKWKKDARMDGRGHSLNRYDGGEESTVVFGVEYYAYRQ